MLRFVASSNEPLPSQALERAELEKLLARVIERMPQAERTVLSLYYQEELTLREIANVMDLHESRISQLKSQGLVRLRAFMQKMWPERGMEAGRTAR
jgi:RNA polymerase sigma factor for flagellar operon FliA